MFCFVSVLIFEAFVCLSVCGSIFFCVDWCNDEISWLLTCAFSYKSQPEKEFHHYCLFWAMICVSFGQQRMLVPVKYSRCVLWLWSSWLFWLSLSANIQIWFLPFFKKKKKNLSPFLIFSKNTFLSLQVSSRLGFNLYKY